MASPHPFLKSLLGRQLRVTTSDARMFVGTMKCTDKDRNIILSATYEYRRPPASAVEEVARAEGKGARAAVKVDMSSRFLGLVVVPGEYIERVEVEGEMGMAVGEQRRGVLG